MNCNPGKNNKFAPMKIKTLIENLTTQQAIVAEHGLSVYIETDDTKILFDTGQTGLFMQNAEIMGIDIKDVDLLVLSHGHYDHTGGLYPFLEENTKAKVYAKRGIFEAKYNINKRFIGTERIESLLNNRLVIVESETEIAHDVFIMPNIKIYHPIDTHFNSLYLQTENGLVGDEFNDELFLVLKQNEKIFIITACSHRGITNICSTAVNYFKNPVELILGGFHTRNCSAEQYQHIKEYLEELHPHSIGVCHCTGVEKYAKLRHDLPIDVFYNDTGKSIFL